MKLSSYSAGKAHHLSGTPEPRAAAARGGSPEGERGAILILSMLVIMVLACVVVQLYFTTSVTMEIANQQKTVYPMRQAARGALLQAKAVLLQDLEDQSMTEETGDEGGGIDGSMDGGLDGGTGGDTGGDEPDSGGMDGEMSEGGDTAGGEAVDSIVDEWARPGAISLVFANELEVRVFIRDEDSKFNILSVVAKDDDFAMESRDRLMRLVDTFREDTRHDISRSQAERITDSIVNWLEGDRPDCFDTMPKVKTGKDDIDPERLDEDPIHYPLTLDELQMCEGLSPEILFGFEQKGERIPGLAECITCYSNLIFDEIAEDEEEGDDFLDNNQFDDSSVDEEGDSEKTDGEEDEEEEPEEVETNNGCVNINTATFAVLRALLEDDQIPNSFLEKLVEFREEALDAWEEAEDRAEDWISDGDGEEGDGLDYEDDEDFIFRDPSEVISRVEKYFETSFNIDNDAEQALTSMLAVTSNVFTIYISVQVPESKLVRNYRTVVWRWSGSSSSAMDSTMGGEESENPTDQVSGTQIITLIPLEPWPFPLPLTEREKETEFPEH